MIFKTSRLQTLIFLVLAVALVLRLALFLGMMFANPDGFFRGDSVEYWRLSENIIHDLTFSQDQSPPFRPAHDRTPLYPFFLAVLKAIGLSVPSIIVVQILFSTACCLLVILLSYRLTGEWTPGILAGLFLALDIPSIAYANAILTETFFTFLLLSSIVLLVIHLQTKHKAWPLYASGFLLGLSILCRPIAVFLPLFIFGAYWFYCRKEGRRVVWRAMGYLTVSLLVILPWIVRNEIHFGTPFLGTTGYRNMWGYRAAGVYAVRDNVSLQEGQQRILEDFNREHGTPFQADHPKSMKALSDFAVSTILAHPLLYAYIHLRGDFHMLFKPLRSTLDQQLGIAKGDAVDLTALGTESSASILVRLRAATSTFTLVLVTIQLVLLVCLYAATAVGIADSFFRKDELFLLMFFLYIGYFCLLSGGPEANARFRVPIMPLLAVAAGMGTTAATRYVRNKGR